MLIDEGSVKLNFLHKKVVYHSPCELGRGSGVYDEPKEVLSHVSKLEKSDFEDMNSLCCGGSLANMKISSADKKKIAFKAAGELTKKDPDILATACPLCKKTFSSVTQTRVADISEIVAEALNLNTTKKINSRQFNSMKEMAKI
jgi:Fe-S oxidoreductase